MRNFYLFFLFVLTYALGTYCRPEEVGVRCPITWHWFNLKPVCGRANNNSSVQLIFNSRCDACSNSSIKMFYKGLCWNPYRYCRKGMICNDSNKKVCAVSRIGLPVTYNNECEACMQVHTIGYIDNQCENIQNKCDKPGRIQFNNAPNCVFYPNRPYVQTSRLGCQQDGSIVILGDCPISQEIDYSSGKNITYIYCNNVLEDTQIKNSKGICGIFKKGLPVNIGNPIQWCQIRQITAYVHQFCDQLIYECPATRTICDKANILYDWCGFGELNAPENISSSSGVCCQGTIYTHFMKSKCPI